MTNGYRIRRQMSNEGFAEWVDKVFGFSVACNICAKGFCEGDCEEGIKAYLESEEK